MILIYIFIFLDDFFLCAPSEAECATSLNSFIELCATLGVPIAPEKKVGPAITLSFVGIELDTILSECCLPLDKVISCQGLVDLFLSRKKVSLKELQTLIGKLNFACSVVVPGRAFLRRLIDLTIGLRHPRHLTRVTREVRLDLLVWKEFLSQFNGKSFFIEDRWE